MIALDALPQDLHAEYALAYEVRAVHDTATLRLSDYRSGGWADWIVAMVKPDPGSGSATVPGAYLDAASGRVVAPAQASMEMVKKGLWQAVAAAEPTAPASGRYAWTEPVQERPRGLRIEDVYSPFAYGGAIVFGPNPKSTGLDAFAACKLLFPDWIRAAGPALRLASTAKPLLNEGTTDAAGQAELLDLAAGDNPVSATLAFRAAVRGGVATAPRARALLRAADPHRLSVFLFIVLTVPGTTERADWLQEIADLIAETTAPQRLLAFAYAAFSAGLLAARDPAVPAASRRILSQVRERTRKLDLTLPADSPLALILRKSGIP